MDQCIKAASGLLDYARDNFSTQFSFQNNTRLTPLGIAFSQYTPIEYIGLIPRVSLVSLVNKRRMNTINKNSTLFSIKDIQ